MVWRGLPLILVACSTSGPPADAGPDVCNHYIPSATVYDCEAGAASGCSTDPSDGGPSETRPVGCNATTTRSSVFDINCGTASMCDCHPLTCTCTSEPGLDGGAEWICPQ